MNPGAWFRGRRRAALGTAIALVAAGALCDVFAGRLLGVYWPWRVFTGVTEALIRPSRGLPGPRPQLILLLGVDDSAGSAGTPGADKYGNSDAIVLAALWPEAGCARLVFVPRDAYARMPIAGGRGKIGTAYAHGGGRAAMDAVGAYLGAYPSHYVAIRTSGLARIVDAVGGVDINVPAALNYDDVSGRLHVHLQPGWQRLSGAQAAQYARYRHPNRGRRPTPADGDLKRTDRVEDLLRSVAQRSAGLDGWYVSYRALDTALQVVQTDLPRQRLLDLMMVARYAAASSVMSVHLAGLPYRDASGGQDVDVSSTARHAAAVWLVGGAAPSDQPG